MRHYQRGIATSIILVIFLIAGVAVVSGFLVFYQNQQKIGSINSFEECGKYYPVMESYPAQCNTPDGRHFVQELSEKEKEKLKPPAQTDEAVSELSICMHKKSKDDGDYERGALLAGFNTGSLDESKEVVAGLGLGFEEEYASSALNMLKIKVQPGEEYKWICLLENNPKVKYVEVNKMIKLDDCNKGPC